MDDDDIGSRAYRMSPERIMEFREQRPIRKWKKVILGLQQHERDKAYRLIPAAFRDETRQAVDAELAERKRRGIE